MWYRILEITYSKELLEEYIWFLEINVYNEFEIALK